MTWDEMVAWYNGLSEDDPDKHEFEAFVYMRLSYACSRKAEIARRPTTRHRSRRER